MQNIHLKIKKRIFNSVYYPYLDDQRRTQIFFGGSSSGKSFFAVGQRVVYDLMKGGRNYLIVRNVANTSRMSTFKEVTKTIRAWNLNQYFQINKTEMVITSKLNGYQVIFYGLDDVDKVRSATAEKGVITDCLLEESTEMRKDDVTHLRKRLRGPSKLNKRITFIFNPIFRSHWLFEKYFAGKFNDDDNKYEDENMLILKTMYKDNLRFLEQDDIDELENEEDEYFYNVFTLGKWGILGDIIFKNWKVEDLSDQIPQFDNIRNGLDFGFAKDPATYNRIHYDRMRKKIYIFDELHEYGLTNQEMANRLQPIIGTERIVCDSAEPKSIQELVDCDIRAVGAVKGKGSVNFGIQWLQGHEIVIHKECQETINEFQLYQWKKTRTGETISMPVDKNDHHISDIRYGLEDDMISTEIYVA